MAMHRPRDYEQRVRAVRKRLALDFQPLRDTLSRGLDVPIDPEAAVLCTATVEAMCDALFHIIVKNLHDDAATSHAPLDTKVTVYHIHVALRSHANFAQLLAGVDTAADVLKCFLDDATSRALNMRHLLTTPEAKHLRPSPFASSVDALPLSAIYGDDEALEVARHDRTRSEWQKREDEPFQDVDFAMVLKCVHPAFTLTHSATLLLSALVRELLNAVCDVCDLDSVQRRVPPELYVEDLEEPLARVFYVGELATTIDKTARECLERFRLRSRQGTTLTLRCRVFASGGAVRTLAATYELPQVLRDAPFGNVLIQLSKKCRVDAATHVGVYRGHTVDATATPRILGMPTGAVVYLVRTKWWDHVRRNDARRGLLIAARVSVPRYGGGESSPTADETRYKSLTLQPPTASNKELFGRKSNMSVHAASASRLVGVGGRRGREGRGGERYAQSEGDDSSDSREGGEGQEEEEEKGEEEDSLSRLVRQRHREIDRKGNNHPRAQHAAPSKHDASRRDLLATMATQSVQLMDTLDEAWLGFAEISAGARSLKASIERQLEEEEGGRGRGGGERSGPDALENELRMRLQKTGDLVRQTTMAHELVAQLLCDAKRLRMGPIQSKDGANETKTRGQQ